MSAMSRIYANRMEREVNPINFDEVPAKLKAETKQLVEADGYIIDDEGWAKKVEE